MPCGKFFVAGGFCQDGLLYSCLHFLFGEAFDQNLLSAVQAGEQMAVGREPDPAAAITKIVAYGTYDADIAIGLRETVAS